MATGQKSFVMTWLLSWLLGGFGIDRFYLGKIGTGFLKFLTAGGLGLWYLYDLLMTLSGRARDKSGQSLSGYDGSKNMAWIVTIVVWLLGLGVGGYLQFS